MQNALLKLQQATNFHTICAIGLSALLVIGCKMADPVRDSDLATDAKAQTAATASCKAKPSSEECKAAKIKAEKDLANSQAPTDAQDYAHGAKKCTPANPSASDSSAASAKKAAELCMERIKQDTILFNIAITPENGGFNPAFGASKVSGQVLLGANACKASGVQAKFEQQTDAQGKITLIARLDGWREAGKICPEIYTPQYQAVSLTVRATNEVLSQATIKNTEEMGLDATLASPCFEATICTREMAPTACLFEGRSFEGNNRCEAMSKVKVVACLRKISPDTAICEARTLEQPTP